MWREMEGGPCGCIEGVCNARVFYPSVSQWLSRAISEQLWQSLLVWLICISLCFMIVHNGLAQLYIHTKVCYTTNVLMVFYSLFIESLIGL